MANQLETQLTLASSLGLSELSKTAIMRGLFSLDGTQIKYSFRRTKSYQIGDPEEKVRADTIAFLVLSKGYDSRKIDTEVEGSHNDFADIVLYEDDRCTKPWLVVENKKEGATPAEKAEGEAQAFANGIALGAKYSMKDYGDESCVWQLEGFGARGAGEISWAIENFFRGTTLRIWCIRFTRARKWILSRRAPLISASPSGARTPSFGLEENAIRYRLSMSGAS